MGGGADERVAQRPQEACLVHGASGEGDRLLGGVLGRGHHRKAAHPRRLETLPLGGTTIPPTMTPIDGSSKMQTVDQTYFTVEEVAERLKVSHMTVYRWIKAGSLGAYKLGGEFRITERDIDQFLDDRRFRAKGDSDA